MEKEFLSLLKSGDQLYYRAELVSFGEILPNGIIIIEVPGLPFRVEEESKKFLFEKNKNTDSVTKIFREQSGFFYSAVYGPKNPELKQKMIGFWLQMCELAEDQSSSKFVDVKYQFEQYLRQLRTTLSTIDSLSVGGISFFAEKPETHDPYELLGLLY